MPSQFDAMKGLNNLTNRVKNVLDDYKLREKKLVSKCKSLEFEVKTLKDIIIQLKSGLQAVHK